MTEQERRMPTDDPAEGDRERVDRAIEESPAKGLLDEDDPDPPEPGEPG